MTSWFVFSLSFSLIILILSSLVCFFRFQKISVHYRLGSLGLGLATCIGLFPLYNLGIIPSNNLTYMLYSFCCWFTSLLYISFIIDFTSVRRSPFFWLSYFLPIPLAIISIYLSRPLGLFLLIASGAVLLAILSFWYLYNWLRSATDDRARRDGEWMLMVFIVFGIGFVVCVFNALTGVFWVLSLWFLVVHFAVNHLNILNQLTGQENLVVIDNIFDIVFILDANGRIVRMNRRAFQISGYNSTKAYGTGIETIVIHSELSQEKRSAWLEKYNWIDRGVDSIRGPSIDAWLSTDRGEEVPVDLRVIALQDLRRRITGYILSATDMRILRQLMKEISDREYASRGLALSESKFSRLFAFNPSGILIVDLDTHCITDANPAIEEILETSAENLIGRDLFEIGLSVIDMSPEIFIEKLQMESSVPEFQGTLKQAGRRMRTCRMSAVSFDLNNNRRMLLSITDVTSHEQMREALTRKQKVETIGVLSGGIAHDFNNILAVILGQIGIARMRIKDPHSLSPVEKAEKACLRARELTGQLLAFSRGGAPVLAECAIRSLLIESAMIGASDSSVSCSFDISQDIWNIRADKIQIGQILSNLVVNAVEAMDKKGIIQICARNADFSNLVACRRPQKVDSLPLPAGKYVEIRIIDQGPGIPDAIKPYLFEPFYTTKEKGTGMGLSIVFSVVQNHGGTILVDSVDGEGSTFTLYLPAVSRSIDLGTSDRRSADLEMKQMKSDSREALAEKKVLLMDDNSMVLETATAILTSLGYSVTCASNGEEALSIFKDAYGTELAFSFCILDQVVPNGMSGSDCAKEILKIDSSAIIFVSSGYSDDPVMANFNGFGFRGVIQKPYTIEEMKNVISNLLVL